MPYQADIEIHVAVYRDERRVFTVTIINILCNAAPCL